MVRQAQVERLIAAWEERDKTVGETEEARAWSVVHSVERAATPEEIGVAVKTAQARRWGRRSWR